MTAFLLLLGIVTGACALVVLADYFGTDPAPRLFGDSDYLAPWTRADREPGDLGGES